MLNFLHAGFTFKFVVIREAQKRREEEKRRREERFGLKGLKQSVKTEEPEVVCEGY